MNVDEFFATARERYRIWLNREANKPWPWSTDPIFKEWRFCNVHREHDRTTIWFRENMRSRVEGLKAIRVTFLFRWFNRIETADKIKDLIMYRWDRKEVRRRLLNVRPLVTGAYMLKTRTGRSKLDGIMSAIRKGLPMLREIRPVSMEGTVRDLCEIPYLGPFTAYEIASDLRWTSVLNKAPDIMTWANPGPGCAKGLKQIFGNGNGYRHKIANDRAEMVEMMREIMKVVPDHWPAEFERLEMREIQHWAGEFHLYKRAQLGYRLKRRYTLGEDER